MGEVLSWNSKDQICQFKQNSSDLYPFIEMCKNGTFLKIKLYLNTPWFTKFFIILWFQALSFSTSFQPPEWLSFHHCPLFPIHPPSLLPWQAQNDLWLITCCNEMVNEMIKKYFSKIKFVKIISHDGVIKVILRCLVLFEASVLFLFISFYATSYLVCCAPTEFSVLQNL